MAQNINLLEWESIPPRFRRSCKRGSIRAAVENNSSTFTTVQEERSQTEITLADRQAEKRVWDSGFVVLTGAISTPSGCQKLLGEVRRVILLLRLQPGDKPGEKSQVGRHA